MKSLTLFAVIFAGAFSGLAMADQSNEANLNVRSENVAVDGSVVAAETNVLVQQATAGIGAGAGAPDLSNRINIGTDLGNTGVNGSVVGNSTNVAVGQEAIGARFK